MTGQNWFHSPEDHLTYLDSAITGSENSAKNAKKPVTGMLKVDWNGIEEKGDSPDDPYDGPAKASYLVSQSRDKDEMRMTHAYGEITGSPT